MQLLCICEFWLMYTILCPISLLESCNQTLMVVITCFKVDWIRCHVFFCLLTMLFSDTRGFEQFVIHPILIKVQLFMYQKIPFGPRSDSLHHHSSRGWKTVTFQSWRSKRNLGRQEIYVVNGGSGTPTQEFLFNLQLWQVTVLQPLELWWWKVAHLKAPSYIYWQLTLKTA